MNEPKPGHRLEPKTNKDGKVTVKCKDCNQTYPNMFKTCQAWARSLEGKK